MEQWQLRAPDSAPRISYLTPPHRQLALSIASLHFPRSPASRCTASTSDASPHSLHQGHPPAKSITWPVVPLAWPLERSPILHFRASSALRGLPASVVGSCSRPTSRRSGTGFDAAARNPPIAAGAAVFRPLPPPRHASGAGGSCRCRPPACAQGSRRTTPGFGSFSRPPSPPAAAARFRGKRRPLR